LREAAVMGAQPVLAVTAGDPAGIGAEIIIKALLGRPGGCVLVIIGDLPVFQAAASAIGTAWEIPVFTDRQTLAEAVSGDGEGPFFYDCGVFRSSAVPYGTVDERCGRAAYAYIETAAELIAAGIADGLVTGPINKESLQAAGVPHIGHTEILGALTDTDEPLTMFETLGMRIFFLSRHVPLSTACTLVTEERVFRYITICCDALAGLGLTGSLPLAVAGLNPHSGEHGLFGREEVEAVTPAVQRARRAGYNAVGPIGADSVFHQAKTGRCSAVLSLYHDQGHIAAKTLDFERTVSVTLGLPFLRTSVDHGTAFDIAGTGRASEVSMLEAVKVASAYIQRLHRA
jgi:4-phospho-D-threonate 3-dehydrogenase / 4-phospho-D-erythronate 3-dehydrogenase